LRARATIFLPFLSNADKHKMWTTQTRRERDKAPIEYGGKGRRESVESRGKGRWRGFTSILSPWIKV
jgi:hypothetical protein